MRIIARTIGALTVTGGADRVLCAVPIPKGGKVLSVTGEVHVVGEESQDVSKFRAYGFGAEMVAIPEPETAIDMQSLWDNIIVKAADPTLTVAGPGFDFDWDTANTATWIEPGEIDVDALLGMTQDQKEIIAPRLEWVTWAKSRQGGFLAGTPDTYLPSDYKTFRSRRRVVADSPSMAMIAVSSPDLGEVEEVATFLSPGDGGAWYMLQNMRETLRDMGKIQAGIIETGAESPYADATALIRDLVARNMLDESTTMYDAQSWDAMVQATWLLDFPGDSVPNFIDGR